MAPVVSFVHLLKLVLLIVIAVIAVVTSKGRWKLYVNTILTRTLVALEFEKELFNFWNDIA